MNYRTNFNSSYANRGMALENDINETNKYYREYDIALIYKKPTPIRVTKTNYQNITIYNLVNFLMPKNNGKNMLMQ